MATEEWQTYCPRCQTVILGRRDKPNHLLHFIITFFTCGLWIIPWVFIGIEADARPFRCPICGTAGTDAPLPKPPITPQPIDQQRLSSSTMQRRGLVIVIGLVFIGLTYAAYLGRQAKTESKQNATVADRPSAPQHLRTSAKSATPEVRKAIPVRATATPTSTISDAAVIAHADAAAAEVAAAVAADPLHDHFPKPDPGFFNSLSDRQMELWEKEFKQRRLQGQMQRQRP
jgi:hypothetical protein